VDRGVAVRAGAREAGGTLAAGSRAASAVAGSGGGGAAVRGAVVASAVAGAVAIGALRAGALVSTTGAARAGVPGRNHVRAPTPAPASATMASVAQRNPREEERAGKASLGTALESTGRAVVPDGGLAPM